MLSDDAREETERLIDRILDDAIPDEVDEWALVGPHQIAVKTTTDRYFVLHITPVPGVLVLEEYDANVINKFINSHLN